VSQEPAEAGPHLPNDPSWGKVTRDPEEIQFLMGPDSRGSELARIWRITRELFRGFRALAFVGPCVTVFGSARFPPDHPYYKLACDLGSELARAGFTVMTGGGPGIMEAANRGAKLAGGISIGCNIQLPKEQHENPYLDRFVTFRYFFVRKLMLVKYSYAFIALPGGFGTLDELFETLTLIQTKKLRGFPVVLMGKEFWEPLLTFMKSRLLREKTIEATDMDLFLVTDSAKEAADHVREIGMKAFGLSYGAELHPKPWLGERPKPKTSLPPRAS
jgi:uncharacterized protein (TIGR00730 family)